jgi:hypothetical protein
MNVLTRWGATSPQSRPGTAAILPSHSVLFPNSADKHRVTLLNRLRTLNVPRVNEIKAWTSPANRAAQKGKGPGEIPGLLFTRSTMTVTGSKGVCGSERNRLLSACRSRLRLRDPRRRSELRDIPHSSSHSREPILDDQASRTHSVSLPMTWATRT